MFRQVDQLLLRKTGGQFMDCCFHLVEIFVTSKFHLCGDLFYKHCTSVEIFFKSKFYLGGDFFTLVLITIFEKYI